MIGCKPITKPICKWLNAGSNFIRNGSNFGKGGLPFAAGLFKRGKGTTGLTKKTCKVRHLSLPNHNVHALLAGFRMIINQTCQVQSNILKVQISMMHLTGHLILFSQVPTFAYFDFR